MAKLTTKQLRFIAAYAGNGVEAARAAGYKGSDDTLSTVARENLGKPRIAKAIAGRESKVVDSLIADRAERQRFWTSGMRGQRKDVDPLRASELLGKSESDFIERHEHSLEKTLSDWLLEARAPSKES